MKFKLFMPFFALFIAGSLMANMTPPKKAAKNVAIAWSPQFSFTMAKASLIQTVAGVSAKTYEGNQQRIAGGSDLSILFALGERVALILPLYARLAVPFSEYQLPKDPRLFNLSLGTGLGTRLFLSGPAFESGWYVDAMGKFGMNVPFVKIEDRFEAGDAEFEASAQVLLGYAVAFNSGFMLNFSAGIEGNLTYHKEQVAIIKNEIVTLGVAPVAGISLGYAW